jgi:hypothetical protein
LFANFFFCARDDDDDDRAVYCSLGRGGGGADFSKSKDDNSVFKAPASASMPLRLFVEGKEGITFNPF